MDLDEHHAWVEKHFELFREALTDPTVRFELLKLLGGDTEGLRQRRLQEAADEELGTHELRWERREEA